MNTYWFFKIKILGDLKLEDKGQGNGGAWEGCNRWSNVLKDLVFKLVEGGEGSGPYMDTKPEFYINKEQIFRWLKFLKMSSLVSTDS